MIGTIRRECLGHVIVFTQTSLLRHLRPFLAYYHDCRTHLSLDKDAPTPRAVEPPERGQPDIADQLLDLQSRWTRSSSPTISPLKCKASCVLRLERHFREPQAMRLYLQNYLQGILRAAENGPHLYDPIGRGGAI
ncbi:MAG: hypothetical protein IT167_29570 [Bryobacterales bacterium]|nr:hypothetical protein [Bryobacterales bacterium]